MIDMADKSKVEVSILGNRYKLTSSENSPEKLEALAAKVDLRMRETAQRFNLFNNLHASVLTALQLQEELDKLQQDYDELITLLED